MNYSEKCYIRFKPGLSKIKIKLKGVLIIIYVETLSLFGLEKVFTKFKMNYEL